MPTLIAVLFLLQEPPSPDALAARCGSEIPWIHDGTELVDMELAAGHHPQFPEARTAKGFAVDRLPLLQKAKAVAAERRRLILWYVPRVAGLHMYRAVLPDRHMQAVAFSDPGMTALIQAKFVPLRACLDEPLKTLLGIQGFDFVEPGFIFMTPDGKVVHRIDRIRTYNADWFRAALVAVLRAHPEFNAPVGEGVEDLMAGGDDETAFARASTDQKALILRRQGRFQEALALDPGPLQHGMALLGLQRFAEARKALQGLPDPEALYALGAVDAWTGKDPSAALQVLLRAHPDSPWAWRAAAQLARAEDTLPRGPLQHHLEDFFLVPPEGIPASTRKPASDALQAARRGLDYLLRAQLEDGSWRGARYAYWPDERILPNVFSAITAMAALALAEWRELDPARIDAALLLAGAWLRDDRQTAPGRHEESYAQAYRLHYFARQGERSTLQRIVARLAEMQDAEGHWGHEYPNPFSTAAVVHALAVARRAGADVPDVLLRRAADAILATRAPDGRQAYRTGPQGPDNEKSSSSRSALCELALQEAGWTSGALVKLGVERYWKFQPRLEAVRLCDYHSDGRLAGFFYFHAAFHTLEAALTLDDPLREESRKRFREQILQIPEWDGSFVDSHEIGKSYGTAMALILLSRTR